MYDVAAPLSDDEERAPSLGEGDWEGEESSEESSESSTYSICICLKFVMNPPRLVADIQGPRR